MALNVKAALFVCTSFIGALCWLIDQVALPLTEVTPPLIARESASAGSMSAPTPNTTPRVSLPTGVTPRFTRGNPFERQAEENLRHENVVAVATVPEAEPARSVVLPPPTYSEVDETVYVSAEPTVERPLSLAAFTNPASVETIPAATPAALSAPASRQYAVRKGDSLTRIAQRHWDSSDYRLVQLLIATNPVLADRPDHVTVGQKLTIPDDQIVRQVLNGVSPAKALKGSANVASARGTANHLRATGQPRWYTIRKQDSLTSIAARQLNDGRRWREIAELNGLNEPGKIIPGMRIKLPPPLDAVRS
ncbi:MAG: LysM domain-containing protein [Planctomycetota bacterium]